MRFPRWSRTFLAIVVKFNSSKVQHVEDFNDYVGWNIIGSAHSVYRLSDRIGCSLMS